MSIEADLPLNHAPSGSPNGDGGAVLVTRGRREFASTRSLTAARYDVVVPRHDRARALGVLGGSVSK